jgi:hypothetical protein
MNMYDLVHKHYDSGVLVYYQGHMPKQNPFNMVYYPYCKYTLDVNGLLNWLVTDTEPTLETMLEVDDALFNKDKPAVYAALAELAKTNPTAQTLLTLKP